MNKKQTLLAVIVTAASMYAMSALLYKLGSAGTTRNIQSYVMYVQGVK